MTLYQALEMIERGESPEEYKKRMARLKRLYNEKYDLEDAIEILGNDPRSEKKKKRLKKVETMISELS